MPYQNVISATMRWMQVRPALTAAGLLAAGISLHAILWRSPLFWLLCLTASVVLALQISRYRLCATVCLGAAILCGGIAAGQMAAYQFRTNQIGLFASDTPQLCELELQFSQTPRLITSAGPRVLPGAQSGEATVVAVRTWHGWEPASGNVEFYFGHDEPRISAGERVRIVGTLGRPESAVNPGQFDWAAYDRSQRILAEVRVSRPCDVNVINPAKAPFIDSARTGVREWLALGFTHERDADLALLQALLLGDRGPALHEVERDFQKTGTSHLLSSSGLRMSVLAALVFLVCRIMRAKPRVAAAVIPLAVLGWGCLTHSTPQAIRPVIVTAALGLGMARGRMVDSIQYLGFAAVMLLIVQPLDLYSAGFQFSFVIVLGMLLLTRPLVNYFQSFENRDHAALARFGHLKGSALLRHKLFHRAVQVLAAAIVAWVVSIPLVAYHFEQFTPWAVPIGIVLSPVVLLAVGMGFLKILATMLIPSMSGTWATMSIWPAELLHRAIGAAAHLPAADVPVSRPPIWAIGLFYAMLVIPLTPATGPIIRWSRRCAPLGGFALFLLMPWLLGSASQSASSGKVRLTLLSVGAGQCAVLETPDRGPILIDAGSSTLADPFHSCLGPFLHHERQTTIDAIYLSHGDFDHISATSDALADCGIGKIITTPFFRAHAHESIPCRHLLELLDSTAHTPSEVTAGQTMDWGGGVRAEVLWPPKYCEMNSNNAGMVLRVVFGERSILFPADIQDPAMHELLKSPAKLRSDVLVAPHHGSSEPLTAEFIRAVSPSVILSSNSTRLTKKQRDFEHLIDRRPLYRTSNDGAITVEIDRSGQVSVTPFLDRRDAPMVMPPDNNHPSNN